jgi:hypothetical protein
VKVGDLVRNLNSEGGLLGVLIRWRTFDKKTNPYRCPEVFWFDGRLGTIQTSMIEVVSDD